MKFIKLTRYLMTFDNKKYDTDIVYVNPNCITMIAPPRKDYGTAVFIKEIRSGSPFFVKESIEEIMSMIEEV